MSKRGRSPCGTLNLLTRVITYLSISGHESSYSKIQSNVVGNGTKPDNLKVSLNWLYSNNIILKISGNRGMTYYKINPYWLGLKTITNLQNNEKLQEAVKTEARVSAGEKP